MSKNIKNFSEFRSSSNEEVNEGVGDFLSGLLSSGSNAFSDVIKSKIISYLYDYLGIKEGSFMGTVLEKVGQQIDVSEYVDLFTGGNIPTNKFAEKLADATFEVLTVMGVRPLAEKLGVDNTNGLIYRTIEEMFTNEAKKREFRDSLVTAWTWILGGTKNTSMLRPEGKGGIKDIFDFTPSEKRKIASDPAIKSLTKGSEGMKVSDILSSLTGGSPTSGGKSLIGG
jgi:hypothetical protein